MDNEKRICFDLEEFKSFFFGLDLNCSFNEVNGNIVWVDGIILKGEIKGSE